MRWKIQPASNEASVCGVFIIISWEASRPYMALKIVVCLNILLIVGVILIEPQVCWWSSQNEFCFNFVNADIKSLYRTPIQVGIVTIGLKFKIRSLSYDKVKNALNPTILKIFHVSQSVTD